MHDVFSSSDDIFLSFSFTIQFPILNRRLVYTARQTNRILLKPRRRRQLATKTRRV